MSSAVPPKPLLFLSLIAGLAIAMALPADAQPRPDQQRGPGGGPRQGGPGGGGPQGQGGPAPMQRQATEADVDALLDEGLVADPARLDAARQKAAAPPPQSTDPDTLVRFYFERGQAAQLSANPRRFAEDMREAARHVLQATSIDRYGVFMQLAIAEQQSGRRPAAIAALETAVAHVGQQRPRLLTVYSRLAELHIQGGNSEAADRALAQARSIMREMENNPRFQANPNIRRQFSLVEGSTAVVQDFRGQYAQAEASHRRTLAILEERRQPSDQGRILQRRLLLTANLRLQGRLAEAENEARQQLTAAQQQWGLASTRTGNALASLALILGDQGRFAEAEGLARRSIDILAAAGLRGARSARIVLANALAAQGKWPDALREFDAMRSGGGMPDEFESFTRRNLILPLAQLKTGRSEEALARFQRIYDENKTSLGDRHAVTAESRGFLAMAQLAQGQRDAALAGFADAAAILLTRSRESSDTEDSGSASAADQRQRLILDAYIDTLADIAASGGRGPGNVDAAAEAFRLADAARGRSVLRALAASAARAAASDPALGDIARRMQDAEKQISALNGLLANAISARAEDRDEHGIRALRQNIDALRDERGKLSAEIERKLPDYARLVNPDPATVADVQKSLRPGEAMLAIFAGERRTYAWAVPKSGGVTMAAAPIDRIKLAESVARLRRALDPNAATLDDVPAFDVDEAHRLYTALLGSVETGWKDAGILFTVPDGALAQLPLALLVTAPTQLRKSGTPFAEYRDVQFLARRAAVAQLPSVSSLAALRAVPAPRGERRAFIGFGDPWFSKEQQAEANREAAVARTAAMQTRGIRLRSAPKGDSSFTAEYGQLPRLPETADEVKAIAAALRAGAEDVILGAQASPSTVKKMDLRNRRVVMFATHGLVPGDLSGLGQPALALSSPDVTGNPADGLLTVEDILALRLNADWVVLSACNTAAAQGAGAEAVSGLGRAFFYAGTRALLVSNWPVESESARQLTTDLFRRQVEDPGLSRAEAQRRAMLALIDGPGAAGSDGKPMFSYAHPIFWAPFSLVGDGGVPAQ